MPLTGQEANEEIVRYAERILALVADPVARAAAAVAAARAIHDLAPKRQSSTALPAVREVDATPAGQRERNR